MNDFQEMYQEANKAGAVAAADTGVQMLTITDGVQVFKPFPICGFGWVNVRPGNCAFANWLKKAGLARKAYYGGVDIWISDYDQSYDQKHAHAVAMGKVFADHGIRAYGTGRLD